MIRVGSSSAVYEAVQKSLGLPGMVREFNLSLTMDDLVIARVEIVLSREQLHSVTAAIAASIVAERLSD